MCLTLLDTDVVMAPDEHMYISMLHINASSKTTYITLCQSREAHPIPANASPRFYRDEVGVCFFNRGSFL